MVSKGIVGLFWGTNFQHGGKVVLQNSSTMHFDNHFDPISRSTSKRLIADRRVLSGDPSIIYGTHFVFLKWQVVFYIYKHLVPVPAGSFLERFDCISDVVLDSSVTFLIIKRITMVICCFVDSSPACYKLRIKKFPYHSVCNRFLLPFAPHGVHNNSENFQCSLLTVGIGKVVYLYVKCHTGLFSLVFIILVVKMFLVLLKLLIR